MKLRLCLILLLLFVVTTTVNAQQVIQLQWVEDSGNVQYDELGPYTKINYSDKITFWCVKSSTWVTKCFEDIMVYAGKQYPRSIQLSLDGVNWFDEEIGMRFKCARADTGNTYTCFYAYPHDKGYVISQPIYYSDIDGEDDPDVLVYKGERISVDILDKDGNVYYTNVPSGFTLKMLPKNIFPIRIKVNLQKSAYRQKLEYAQIVLNKFYGYVYDSEGKPVAGATIELTQTDDPTKKFTTTTDYKGYFEIYNLNNSKTYRVNITKDGQLLYNDTIQPPIYRVYGTPAQGNNNGGGNSSGQYGNPNSSYVVELSPSRIYEGQRIKVYVIGKGVGWFGTDVYVEGAEIYVDGQSTGVKTEYHNWWEPWFGWLPWVDKPYAEITLNEPGVHYVYAKLPDGSYSKASPVTVLSLSGSGSENGTYPSTSPDNEDGKIVIYILWADKTTIYKNGEVTFKVYKKEDSKIVGTVEAEIWINDEFVGKTAKPNPLADYELKHKFASSGTYKVYAVVGDKKTSILYVTVLDSLSTQPPSDSREGTPVKLTVKVVDENDATLSGIVVMRLKIDGDVPVEQATTDANGIAVLHPIAGETFLILATDPSNQYLPVSYNGSWTTNSSITLTMKKAGDLDGDGKPDTSVKYIQVRVDGYAEDGHTFYVGKHRISVVDQNGMEIAGAEIYVNGEYIGKTEGWGGIFGAGLDHTFGAGNYTIKAVYRDLADTITIRVIDAIDPNNPDREWLFVKPDHVEGFAIGNITAYKDEPVLFVVAKPSDITNIWDWAKVSGAIIYVNGEQVGVTGKTEYGGINIPFLGNFGGFVGYVHRFNQTGTYEVYAITPDGDRTNTLHVTVVQGPMSAGWLFDNPIMQFFKGIALTAPILGDWHIDAVIWLLIALFVVSIVVRIVI